MDVPYESLVVKMLAAFGCLATSDTALTVTSSQESAPAAGDYPNATLDIGFAHDDAGELVAESLTIPIHLVVA